eukprot:SAG31_NODE_320_length_17748_cov_4.201881_4_plen_85_part_00
MTTHSLELDGYKVITHQLCDSIARRLDLVPDVRAVGLRKRPLWLARNHVKKCLGKLTTFDWAESLALGRLEQLLVLRTFLVQRI